MAAPHSPQSGPVALEALLDRFDQAWRSGTPPRLEEYLPSGTAPDAAARKQLEELLKIDLEYRWRGAKESAAVPVAPPLTLHQYVERFPRLGHAAQFSVELIGEEYRVRQRWGDRPTHAEYARRFPHLAAPLAKLLRELDGELADDAVQQRRAALQEHVQIGTAPSISREVKTQEKPLTSSADLVEALRAHQVLEVRQQTAAQDLARGRADARALARELLQRNWLTPYQVNQLLQGRGAALRIGPYLILERLGEGGAGQVFKARQQKMNRLVAVKVIRKELLTDSEVVRRFNREIQVISRLAHPNVVHALDAGPLGAMMFLAMEYIQGTDLARLVKQSGPLPAAQACAYIRQAALGLQHIHDHGLVHRDIKPPNLLLVQPSGVIKILDLGLARLQSQVDGEMTSMLTPTGAVMIGTPDYMAPEQAVDFHGADIRADIYSLGCTFYYLLTGQPPFPGGMLAEKLLRHQQVEPPPLEEKVPHLPPGLGAIVRRMLGKKPEDRYQTPGEVAEALTSHAGSHALVNRLRGWAQGAWPRRRRPRTWLAAGLAVILALGLTTWALWPSPRVPLDRIDPRAVRAADRLPGMEKDLVAVLSQHGGAPLGGINKLAFSPDGRTLALMTGRTVLLWDIPSLTDRQTPRPGTGNSVGAIAFSPDSQTLAVADGSADAPDLWDLAAKLDSKRRLSSKVARGPMAFAPSGTRLATAGGDNAILLWELAPSSEPKVIQTLVGHDTPINSLEFSPDGQTLASGGNGGALRLWSVAKARDRVLPHGASRHIPTLTFSPDGKTLASVTDEGLLKFWDVATATERPAAKRPPGYSPALYDFKSQKFVGIKLDGVLLADSDLRSTREWKFPGDVSAVALSPEGRYLAVGRHAYDANKVLVGTIYILRMARPGEMP